MGSAQSSDTERKPLEFGPRSFSHGGSNENEEMDMWTEISNENASLDDDSEEHDDTDDEMEVEERLRILQESRQLKRMAEFFLHPEQPVKFTPEAFGRCYFCQPSMEQQFSQEEDEVTQQVLSDARALKKLARDFRHPELPIYCSNGAAYGRCYFERASAPETVRRDEEEKTRILSEVKALKKAAYDYLHPELPVATTDGAVFGRNYFSRYSAPLMFTKDEEIERELVLRDATKLRKIAASEPPEAVTVDPTARGRNYFCRASAPAQTTLEEDEEREHILKDAKALRKLATHYLHPELPVQVHPTALGRNYFSRLSGVGEESAEKVKERQQILNDTKTLRRLATDYLHPELPVQVHSTALLGKNYFSRPSAVGQESAEEVKQRQQILNDAKALHKLAVNYLHPELPVTVTDPTVFGRNYFNRPSAAVQSSSTEDREQVLADALYLERLAMAYHHPEVPIQTDEEAALSRNFYYPKMHASDTVHDKYKHHAHFDMDDDIHLYHVEFDLNSEHHDAITELRISTPSAEKSVVDDLKLATSPGCVMTFTHKPNELNLPCLP